VSGVTTKKIKPRGLAERRARALADRKTRALAATFRDNPVAISEYLNDALSTDDPVLITKAIGDMVRAQGVTRFSKKAGMRRDSLYRMFRGEQSAKLNAAIAVLQALDIQLIAEPMASRGRLPRTRRQKVT
jgi:probable addiction module antidote protein